MVQPSDTRTFHAWWLARRVVGSPADAEDAVQEAWVKVFSRANADVPSERVRAWLRTVVVRCCLDHQRRLSRVPDGDQAPRIIHIMMGFASLKLAEFVILNIQQKARPIPFGKRP